MKSFRNLVLSLLLAVGVAGLAACEGERGPVGEAGPTGTAGGAGPKGAAGDPGKSSDEIPSAYEFLKNWGKADGMAACNDDFLNKKAPFPGLTGKVGKSPLPKAPRPASGQTSVPLQVDIGDPDATGNADKGKCSDEVFVGTAGTNPNIFTFTPTRLGEITRETKMGTTAVLRNPTSTAIKREFWEGTFSVNLKAEAAAAEGTDRLAVRCDGRKRPADDATGGKRITGEYGLVLITEDENILEKDSGGTNVFKDSHSDARNFYFLKNFTARLCIRLASVPGTVKCLVKTSTQERNAADDDKAVLANPQQSDHKKTTKEQIALYKDGQLMQVMPMPYSDGKLAGSAPTMPATQQFPLPGSGYLDTNFSPGKLCNFFDKGVIPCNTGEVPGDDGDCTP